jgi:hypothetical protein
VGAGNISHTHPAGCSPSPTLLSKISVSGISRLTAAYKGRPRKHHPSRPGLRLPAPCCRLRDCTRLVQKTMHCTSHQSGPLLDGRCSSSPPCALHRVRLACLCALQVSCLMLARRPLPQAFSVVITYIVSLTGKACCLRQNPCFTECTIEANLRSGSQCNCGAFCITYGPPPNALCTSNSICPTLPERLS